MAVMKKLLGAEMLAAELLAAVLLVAELLVVLLVDSLASWESDGVSSGWTSSNFQGWSLPLDLRLLIFHTRSPISNDDKGGVSTLQLREEV